MRPKNVLETVTLTITVTKIMAEQLDKAVSTGLYGNSRPACAERLISEGIRGLLRDKTLVKLDKPTLI